MSPITNNTETAPLGIEGMSCASCAAFVGKPPARPARFPNYGRRAVAPAGGQVRLHLRHGMPRGSLVVK